MSAKTFSAVVMAGLAGLVELLTPAAKRDWSRAMLAEWRSLQGGSSEGARWLLGCVAGAAALRARDQSTGYTLFFLVMSSAMIVIDWSTDAVAPSLLMLAAIAGTLGYLAPLRTLGSAVLAGGVLPIGHAIANCSPALWPFYQYKPLDPYDWAILSLLLLPAMVATQIGGMIRRRLGNAR